MLGIALLLGSALGGACAHDEELARVDGIATEVRVENQRALWELPVRPGEQQFRQCMPHDPVSPSMQSYINGYVHSNPRKFYTDNDQPLVAKFYEEGAELVVSVESDAQVYCVAVEHSARLARVVLTLRNHMEP